MTVLCARRTLPSAWLCIAGEMTAENRARVTPTETMAAMRRVLSEVLEVFMIVGLSGRFWRVSGIRRV